jgi:hypothetical protein
MGLLNLPDELLTEIASHVVVPSVVDPPVGMPLSNPDALCDFITSTAPGTFASQQNLLNLSLANRRLNAIAIRVLYRSIHIRHHDTLFYFLPAFPQVASFG